MQKTDFRKILSSFLCIVLIAATALFTTGCQDTEQPNTEHSTQESSGEVKTSEDTSVTADALGEGETSFIFTVTDGAGAETVYKIRTDKTTVGDALLELNLLEGEEGPYGLYIKTVNGITADYNTDGTYWAFYVNGEYASTGVDLTSITEGATYSFKVE